MQHFGRQREHGGVCLYVACSKLLNVREDVHVGWQGESLHAQAQAHGHHASYCGPAGLDAQTASPSLIVELAIPPQPGRLGQQGTRAGPSGG